MNPFVIDACCDICGEKGMATISATADQWIGAQLRHTDLTICVMNLKRKKKELDKIKRDNRL